MKPSFLKSVSFAVNGLKLAWHEKHFKIHVVAAILSTGLGFLLEINSTEWFVILICIGAVIALEMINTAIDRLRKDNFLPEIGMTNEDIWVADKFQSADQAILYKELINEIKKLPPGYRIVFNMYVIDGFTHQEIANQLKISVGTSKSNLSKAKALLRNYIKTNELQQVWNT